MFLIFLSTFHLFLLLLTFLILFLYFLPLLSSVYFSFLFGKILYSSLFPLFPFIFDPFIFYYSIFSKKKKQILAQQKQLLNFVRFDFFAFFFLVLTLFLLFNLFLNFLNKKKTYFYFVRFTSSFLKVFF